MNRRGEACLVGLLILVFIGTVALGETHKRIKKLEEANKIAAVDCNTDIAIAADE